MFAEFGKWHAKTAQYTVHEEFGSLAEFLGAFAKHATGNVGIGEHHRRIQ